jgi:hypothetical protein
MGQCSASGCFQALYCNASRMKRSNHRMKLPGRGRRLPQGWHYPPSPGKFVELAAAPQVMRGR